MSSQPARRRTSPEDTLSVLRVIGIEPEPKPETLERSAPLAEFFASVVFPRCADHPAEQKNAQIALSRFTAYVRERRDDPAETLYVSDLTSELVFGFAEWMMVRKRAPSTADRYRESLQRAGRLAVELGLLDTAPQTPRLRSRWEHRTVSPFRLTELRRLFGSARTMPGDVAGIPAGQFWLALLVTSFDCEIAAPPLLDLPASAFDAAAGTLVVKNLRYQLHPKAAALLAAFPNPQRERLLPWDCDGGRPPYYMLYHRYGELLARARLPNSHRLFERLLATVDALPEILDTINLAAPFRPREIPMRRSISRGRERRAHSKMAQPTGFGRGHRKKRKRPPAEAPQFARIQALPGEPTVRQFFEEMYVPRRLADKSKNTVIGYRTSINRFCEFAACEVTLRQLSDDLIERFLCWCAAVGYAIWTRKGLRGELLSIWRYAWRKRWVETQPRDVDEIRVPKTVPEAWSLEELGRLLQVATEVEGFVDNVPARIFWPAIISTVYETGLRIRALTKLQFNDVDFERGWVKARWDTQKQKADQTLPLTPRTIDLLRTMRRRPGQLLFPWPFSEHNQPLTNRLRLLLKRAGLPHGKRDLWHKLRRTNATFICDTAGEEQAMRQLGHSAISVTRRYIDPRKLSAPRIVDSMRHPEFTPADLPDDPPRRKKTPPTTETDGAP